MCGAIKRKTILIVGLFAILLSSIVNIFSNANQVSAVTASTSQSYVYVEDLYREDNAVHIVLKEDIAVKDITYEYTHYVEGNLESDLVVAIPRKLSIYEYVIDVPANTEGIKIWKIKYLVENDYYKNKFTDPEGKSEIGDLNSIKKKNYITVTSDTLVAYEYSSQNFELPWYMWSPQGLYLAIGDYLFNDEKSASFTWYFNLDKKIDSIIDVDITYATFEYTKIPSLNIDAQYNYKSHDPITVRSDMIVYDYPTFINFAEEHCKVDFAGGMCNELAKEAGEEYFQKPAVGATDYIDKDGKSYDWYVQVSLDDLLKQNSNLLGIIQSGQWLQEVSMLEISYYFEGEEYYDISVLDEDTGEVNIIPDPSIIDKIVEFVDAAYDWISENWKTALIILCVGIILVVLVIKFGFKLIGKIVELIGLVIWFILKWTIFLPITLPYRIIKNRKIEKKKQEDFDKLMANHKRNLEKKNTTRGKKL